MEKINVSAADVIKRTAKQWCYLHKHPKPTIVTERQIEGNEIADRKTTSEYREMRGFLEYGKYNIYYCIDEVQMQGDTITFIEHKNFKEDEEIPEWFMNSSIIQTAVYHALAHYNSRKAYITATFRREQGYPNMSFNLKDYPVFKSLLMIGDISLCVEVINPTLVVEWFLKKLHAAQNYDTAEHFDKMFDRKAGNDFQYLKQFIYYY